VEPSPSGLPNPARKTKKLAPSSTEAKKSRQFNMMQEQSSRPTHRKTNRKNSTQKKSKQNESYYNANPEILTTGSHPHGHRCRHHHLDRRCECRADVAGEEKPIQASVFQTEPPPDAEKS
jgi:hypothetical protein